MEKIYSLQNNFYVNLLLQALPYLKKRESENPDPELVEIVQKIENMQKLIYGDEDES